MKHYFCGAGLVLVTTRLTRSLERRMIFISAGVHEGDKIHNFIACQFVEQTFRHDRHFRLRSFDHIATFNDDRIGFHQWILDQFDDVGGLLYNQPCDDFAVRQFDRVRLILLVDLQRRIEDFFQDIDAGTSASNFPSGFEKSFV